MAQESQASETVATSSSKPKPDYGDCNHPAILHPATFDYRLQAMVEFLHAHPIAQPLTWNVHNIPDRLVITAARSSKIAGEKDQPKTVEFKRPDGNWGVINKKLFCEAVGVSETTSGPEGFFTPEVEDVLALLDLIGYLRPVPSSLTPCKKSKLPAMYQLVIHFFVRCLSGRTGGTDSVSKCWWDLLYCLYHDKKIDLASILWNDFLEFGTHKPDVRCGRFWALTLREYYKKHDIPSTANDNEVCFYLRPIEKYRVQDQDEFGQLYTMPATMTKYMDQASRYLADHIKATVPAEPQRPTPAVDSGKEGPRQRMKNVAKNIKKRTGMGEKATDDTQPKAKKQRLVYFILEFSITLRSSWTYCWVTRSHPNLPFIS